MTTTNQEIFKSPEAFQAALAEAQKVPFPSSREGGDNRPADVAAIESVPITEDVPQSSPETHAEQFVATDEVAAPQEEPIAETQEKSHLIPKSRFNEESAKRKVAEEQLQIERENRIRVESQWEMLNKMQEQQNAKAVSAEPEFEPLDVDTYNYANKKIQELERKLETVSKESSERARESLYMSLALEQEQDFTKEHPDLRSAIEHVRSVEMNVTESFIPDPIQAKNYVDQKLRGIIVGCISNRKNAAETLYNMAKTYGYQNNSTANDSGKPSVNIDNINRNKERTATIQNLNTNGSLGSPPTDFKASLDEKGRFVQEKWDSLMAKNKRAAGYSS